ncbi:uncharacterized protein MAM_07088 [Metarhizium album ARSEF 1941]|uniref:Uncharacterized protein n=1 Tax=Metarhizium album (strain ARSEF 1941) TaxID=1081103 RepID=A0A0B2WMW8_METAS|nr:uncharacterized protein MAM_07088 [Metarhizium album ARSEF 1941]KHN95039.1 hypothetical protein MAM_07088 [Metarhizium album ARSEF 1941]
MTVVYPHLWAASVLAWHLGTALAGPVPQPDSCPGGVRTLVTQHSQIRTVTPVLVSTHCPYDMDIVIDHANTIRCSNAPTDISTVITITNTDSPAVTRPEKGPTAMPTETGKPLPSNTGSVGAGSGGAPGQSSLVDGIDNGFSKPAGSATSGSGDRPTDTDGSNTDGPSTPSDAYASSVPSKPEGNSSGHPNTSTSASELPSATSSLDRDKTNGNLADASLAGNNIPDGIIADRSRRRYRNRFVCVIIADASLAGNNIPDGTIANRSRRRYRNRFVCVIIADASLAGLDIPDGNLADATLAGLNIPSGNIADRSRQRYRNRFVFAITGHPFISVDNYLNAIHHLDHQHSDLFFHLYTSSAYQGLRSRTSSSL